MKIPLQAPCLDDGTVVLRPYRSEDVDDLTALVRECPSLTRQQDHPPLDRSEALKWITARHEAWSQGLDLWWAVERDGHCTGHVNLRPDGSGSADLTCALRQGARGNGTMSRALRLALPWAFSTLELHVVHARAVVGDWDAFRLAWALGFHLDGTVRGLACGPDGRLDAWIGSLRRDEPLTPTGAWLQPPVLENERVRLRPHLVEDAGRMVEACSDPVTHHWLADLPIPYTEQNALGHLTEIHTHHALGQGLYWAVADPRTDLMAGEIGLFGMAGGSMRKAELGYWCHPAERGRGLIAEAVRAVARYALLPRDVGGLDLGRLIIQVCRDNRPSRAVATAAGFRQAGIDRQAQILRDGTTQDIVRYDLLPDELPAATDRIRPQSSEDT